MTFLDHLQRWLKKPEPAGRGLSLTTASVQQLAEYLAAGLGAAAGKQVVIVADPGPAMFETWCALVRLGALPLVLPPTLHQKDFVALLKQSDPTCIILEHAGLLARVLSLPPKMRVRTMVLEGLETSDDELVISRQELEEVATEVLQALGKSPSFGEPSPDTALLLYASAGSSKTPRIFSLTHNEAVQQAIMVADRLRLSEEDRVLAMGPWSHLPTLIFNVLIPVVHGLQVVLSPRPLSLTKAVRQLVPTVVYGPAQVFREFFLEAAETLEGNALTRGMARWAVEVGMEETRRKTEGEGPSPWQQAKRKMAEAMYFRRCRELLSDDIKVMVYSDEGLHPQALGWYEALGLPLVGGYYLAEEGGFLTLETPGSPLGGGLPLPGKRISLTEGGFLCAGEGQRLFQTDDLGEMGEGGQVKVVGHPPPAALEGAGSVDLHRALELAQLSPLVKSCHWKIAGENLALLVMPSPMATEMSGKLSAADAHGLIEEALREEMEESGLPPEVVEQLTILVAWKTSPIEVSLTGKPTCRLEPDTSSE